MHILLIVVTLDGVVQRTVEQRQGKIIPDTYRRDEHAALDGVQLSISALLAEAGGDIRQLLDHLQGGLTANTAGVIILSDRRLKLGLFKISDEYSISDLCFFNEYDTYGDIRSPQNLLASTLNRVLRDYLVLSRRYSDQKYQKIFTLPFRNFLAAELSVLRGICENTIDEPKFSDRLDAILSEFKKRRRPKKYSEFRTQYLIDDKEKHFELGHERHARADTAIPPHSGICILANNYRFGKKVNNEFHFNVSLAGDALMSEDYPDCHGNLRPGGDRKHLNVFPNDFF